MRPRCPDCNHGLQADGWCWIDETHYRPPYTKGKRAMAKSSQKVFIGFCVIAGLLAAWCVYCIVKLLFG